ncbi:MAG: substrate-binding domain-containing protein [Bacteroidales bacterium]
MVKQKLTLYLLLLIITGLTNGYQKQQPKIGFILPNLNNKRYLIEQAYVTEKCRENQIELFFAASDNDEHKQLIQFDEMLQKGAEVIILDPVNRYTAAAMVRKAHEAGVKVISYDRLIVGCKPDAYISFDARKIGELLADYAIKSKPRGKYIILNGDKSDINAVWIQEGILKRLQPALEVGDITISFSMFVENWSESEARHLLQKYLQLSLDTPTAILCSSDLMARGCIAALKGAAIDLHTIFITGQNAEPYACKAILEGQQSMTIYKPVRQLADLAINIALRHIQNSSTSDLLPQRINNGTADIPAQLLDAVPIDAVSINLLIKDHYLQAEKIK